MSNEIRTQSTQTFLSTVADSMTSRIGDTNTGNQARINTSTMELSEDGTYSCDFAYGDSPQTYSLTITPDGKVQMTNLLDNANSEVFQTALTDLNITVPGIETIQTTATQITKKNFSDTLSASQLVTAESQGAFQTFQKKFSDTLHTKLTEQVSSNFADSQSIVQTSFAKQMTQNHLADKRLSTATQFEQHKGKGNTDLNQYRTSNKPITAANQGETFRFLKLILRTKRASARIRSKKQDLRLKEQGFYNNGSVMI